MKAGSVRPFRESKWVMCSSPVVLFSKFIVLLRQLALYRPLPRPLSLTPVPLTPVSFTSAINNHLALYSHNIHQATALPNTFKSNIPKTTIAKISVVSEKIISSSKFNVLGLPSIIQ
jgi:hypothetical protein